MSNNEYSFKTLNYLGSKLRLLDFIEDNIKSVTPNGSGVCDLFAGSGCVTYKISKSFPVVSCDIQHYSKVICDALVSECAISDEDTDKQLAMFNSEYAKNLEASFHDMIQIEHEAICTKNVEMLATILENGSVEVDHMEESKSSISHILSNVYECLLGKGLCNEKSIISRYYGGVYFSYKQAIDMDILLESISKVTDVDKRNVFLAALLSTASDIVDTVGKHFAQPIKARDSNGNIKGNTIYNKAVKDKTVEVATLYIEWLKRYIALPKATHTHVAMQCDYLECLCHLPKNVKTIYADPPYTRDHYSRFYHVLETMALRDSPEISTIKMHGETHVSNGIYRKDRYQSPFCIRSQAPHAFRKMFQVASSMGKNLLLSYSPYDETKKTHPRVVTMQQLTDIAKEFFSSVEIKSAGHFTHNKLNSTEHLLEASDEAEVLFVCTNDISNSK